MSDLQKVQLDEITINLDKVRVPLSSAVRSKLEKKFPYYGAQGIVDFVDNFLFDGEYLLVAEDGENLKSQRANVCNYVTGKFWVNNHAHILQAKNGHDLKYIFYLLNRKDFRPLVTGSAQPKLTQENLSRIELLIHNPSQQKRISAVLSALDSKIDLNNRINVELEAMAKTLYDYWFVQFDFPFDFAQGKPDKNGKPYKSNGGKMVWNKELKREIPVGWDHGVASDQFIFNPSVSFSKDVIGSYIDMSALPTSGFMTDEVQKKAYNGGVKFQNGDVVVARITPCLENGKTGLITLLAKDETGFGSTEFIVLRGKRQPLSCFAACLSRSELFRKFAIANMTGTSGRKRIEAKTLETFGMPIPPEKLLSKFEETVAPFFKTATVNTKQNQHLSSLRDWLLPMLMNGQVKVS